MQLVSLHVLLLRLAVLIGKPQLVGLAKTPCYHIQQHRAKEAQHRNNDEKCSGKGVDGGPVSQAEDRIGDKGHSSL